jgi:hypothetical protein
MLIDPKTKTLLEKKFQEELIEEVDVKVFIREIIVNGEDPEYVRFSKELVKELSQINQKIKPEFLNFGDEIAKELGLSFSPTFIIGKNK